MKLYVTSYLTGLAPLAVMAYFTLINMTGFLIMLIDKLKAKAGAWRVPEKVIFAIAALGGAVGVYAGIRIIRHKSRHRSFTIGIPAIIIFHLTLTAAVIYAVGQI